jgi:hypothetical protein
MGPCGNDAFSILGGLTFWPGLALLLVTSCPFGSANGNKVPEKFPAPCPAAIINA